MRSIAGQGPHPAKQPGSMEEPEIKPCPFCGSVGKLEEESEDGYRFDMYCTNVQYCGGTTSRCRSAAKAIEFWNRRFPGSARCSDRPQALVPHLDPEDWFLTGF